MFKKYKHQILVGLPFFITGSVLFWITALRYPDPSLTFLKPMYFVGIVLIPVYFALQKLSNKFKAEKTTKKKTEIIILFLIISTITYFLLVTVLRKFK